MSDKLNHDANREVYVVEIVLNIQFLFNYFRARTPDSGYSFKSAKAIIKGLVMLQLVLMFIIYSYFSDKARDLGRRRFGWGVMGAFCLSVCFNCGDLVCRSFLRCFGSFCKIFDILGPSIPGYLYRGTLHHASVQIFEQIGCPG